ncbi:hypothetical protein D3C84_909180 [compost metagenome]
MAHQFIKTNSIETGQAADLLELVAGELFVEHGEVWQYGWRETQLNTALALFVLHMEDPTHPLHYLAFGVSANVPIEELCRCIIERFISVLHIEAEHIRKCVGPYGQVTVFR